MTNCIKCKHYVKYLDGSTHCFMRNSFYIVEGVNVFPKDCKDYEESPFRRREMNDKHQI